MEQPGREDRLNAWIATERAARARLGASGTLELAQVAALSPQEFFDRIGSGQLPWNRKRPSDHSMGTKSTSSP